MSATIEEQIKGLLKTSTLAQIRKLYKYRSMQSIELEGIFTKREIYLPRPIDFNDPFDCRPVPTFHKSRLKRSLYFKELARRKFPSENKKYLRNRIKEAENILRENPAIICNAYDDFLRKMGLYCLSEKKDDILMWSHYSDGHKGVCIEFDAFMDAAFSGTMLFGQALQVNYKDDRPVVNIMEIGTPVEYQKALLTKPTHWDYEKEWRIIKNEDEGGPGIHYFQPQILTGVIFGASISTDDKEKLIGWISKYPTKITLYQAHLNENKYQLDIEPIQ